MNERTPINLMAETIQHLNAEIPTTPEEPIRDEPPTVEQISTIDRIAAQQNHREGINNTLRNFHVKYYGVTIRIPNISDCTCMILERMIRVLDEKDVEKIGEKSLEDIFICIATEIDSHLSILQENLEIIHINKITEIRNEIESTRDLSSVTISSKTKEIFQDAYKEHCNNHLNLVKQTDCLEVLFSECKDRKFITDDVT